LGRRRPKKEDEGEFRRILNDLESSIRDSEASLVSARHDVALLRGLLEDLEEKPRPINPHIDRAKLRSEVKEKYPEAPPKWWCDQIRASMKDDYLHNFTAEEWEAIHGEWVD
jgi:hypothetical protein